MQLKEKVAVITRGSIGIGEAVARTLAKEGVHLVMCCVHAANSAWKI